MPGISSECASGACAACTMGFECRHECHAHTRALLKKGPGKPDPRGGVRRKIKIPPNGEIPVEVPVLEVHNTCPKCGEHARPTDVFCRKDGTRLAMGKQCLGCGGPGEPDDVYCWNCGLKHGEKPPEPAAEQPQEDPLVRIRKIALEAGLLKETVIP